MLDDRWKLLIKKIIGKHLPDQNYKIFVFGSRATGTNSKWSDIDIGILGQAKIDFMTLAQIKGELSDLNIPYRTDVVDFSSVTNNFRNVAMEKVIYL